MTCSQQINVVAAEDKSYDDDITVTGIPKGYIIGVTANTPPLVGSTTREIQVQLMPAEWADGGTNTVNSGLYTRQRQIGEAEVKVIVIQDGTVKCENTTAYYEE